MKEKQWYRPDELAEALGISRRTVYRMIKKKMILAYRIGNLWRIPKEEYMKLSHQMVLEGKI